MEKLDKDKLIKPAAVICVIIAVVLGEIVYFCNTNVSTQIFGRDADSLLVSMFLEHWYDVFTSHSPILTLRAFWPQLNTLGYSETMLGPGIIYSLLRVFGLDIFVSYNISFIIIHFAGVIFMYLTLREIGVNRILAYAGLFISLWSCSFTQLSYHSQFFSLAYVPVFTYLMIRMIKNRGKGAKARLLWGILATCAFGLICLSAFYVAYFCSLMLFMLFFFLCIYTIRKKGFKYALDFLKVHIKELLFYGLLQLIWMIPLFLIYLPIYLNNGGYSEYFTLSHSPVLTDIVRTLSYAPVETFLRDKLPFSVIEGFESLKPNIIMETSYGWPLIVFLLFLSCIPMSLMIKKKHSEWSAFLVADVILTILLIYVSVCRFGNTSLWVALGKFIPGASAIRATGRAFAIFTIPVAVIICYCLSAVSSGVGKEKPVLVNGLFICLLVLLIIPSQAPHVTNEDTQSIKAWVDSVPAPPDDCSAVVIFPSLSEGAGDDAFNMNMKGWLLADKYDLNTINGYSGNAPEGWDLIQTDISVYLENARAWLERNGLSEDPGVYYYFIDGEMWIRYSEVYF